MRNLVAIKGCIAWLIFTPATADVPLQVPAGASKSFDHAEPAATYPVPLGPSLDGKIETALAEGAFHQQVWRIPGPEANTLEILRTFRDQLGYLGYETLFECETNGCGGFDFRFATPVVDEPEMRVDLRDFRFLSAKQETSSVPTYLSLLVSKSPENAYVQITQVGKLEFENEVQTLALTDETEPGPVLVRDFAGQLNSKGSAVLEGLVFQKGHGGLDRDPNDSLSALADFMKENPDVKITLVGHSDASGSLSGNISLSKKRARSVLKILVSDYDIDKKRMDFQGIGYLAPRQTNETEQGREANRRVEVILNASAP